MPGFFSNLASKVSSGVQSLGSKLLSGANYVAGKAQSIGNVVANVASKAAPALAIINPALGEAAAAVATGARVASNVGSAVQGVLRKRN